jgi:hypothetical protein
MALMSPFELSNAAFSSTLSILLGIPMPVPHARYLKANKTDYSHIYEWGDSLLNSCKHALWTASHNNIVRIISQLATNYGVTSTGLASHVPAAEPGTQRRGDLSIMANQVLCRSDLLNPDFPHGAHTQLVLDFTLGHTFSKVSVKNAPPRLHVLKRNTIAIMEADKEGTYKADYHAQGHAFAALVANSFGQLGSEFLRFLWSIADFSARNLVPVPLPILPTLGSPPAGDDDSPLIRKFRKLRQSLYHKARLEISLAVYEGIAERVFGRTHALRSNNRYHWRIQDTSSLWHPAVVVADALGSGQFYGGVPVPVA